VKRLTKIRDRLSRSWIFWAASVSFAIYAPLSQEAAAGGAIAKLLAGHWTTCAAGAAFLFTVTALAFHYFQLVAERQHSPTTVWENVAADEQANLGDRLLTTLSELPDVTRATRLVARLNAAVSFVQRQNGAGELSAELTRLADQATQRVKTRHAPWKLLTGTVGLCGVVGAALGIGSANVAAIESAGVIAGLLVVLLFARHGIEQVELRLLHDIDERARGELAGRFETLGTDLDPHLASIRQQLQGVIESSDQLIARQAQVWQQALDAAEDRWQSQGEALTQRLAQALSGAIKNAMVAHNASLAEGAKAFALQQEILIKHTAALQEVAGNANQIKALETALQQNLAALTGTRNFEHTVLRLAAAVQMLTARLQPRPAADPTRQAA